MKGYSKLKRLVTFPHALLCRMVKKRPSAFVYHRVDSTDSEADSDDADSGATTPRTEPQRHVAYSFADEKQSTRTSYLPVPASPQKRARTSPHPSDALSTLPERPEDESQEGHDLQYLYHRIESLNMESSLRNRTDSVRLLYIVST